jgi:hypothetical protein
MACDVLLFSTLTAATTIVASRFERGNWVRLQFSIGDLLSLITTTSMVLGIVFLDDRLSIGNQSTVEGTYMRLCDLPLFDRVMVVFAIACAVWLIVSTVICRLGSKGSKDLPQEVD